jgi:hypothetical protein
LTIEDISKKTILKGIYIQDISKAEKMFLAYNHKKKIR